MRKRLHRTRGGFHRCIHISKVLCAPKLWTIYSASSLSSAARRRSGNPSPTTLYSPTTTDGDGPSPERLRAERQFARRLVEVDDDWEAAEKRGISNDARQLRGQLQAEMRRRAAAEAALRVSEARLYDRLSSEADELRETVA